MQKSQTSLTAQGIAEIRAIESEKQAGQRICIDPFARLFVNPLIYYAVKLFSGYGEKRAPGVQGYIVCRCRYFDEYLAKCLSEGVEQVVLLGAGLDSKAYRPEFQLEGIQFFEVDHPASQNSKTNMLKKVFIQIPSSVAYVPIDFEKENLDKLFDFGYVKNKKTLFLWEGVSYYLKQGSVDATLGWVVKNSKKGSSILFDYINTQALDSVGSHGEIKRMQRYSQVTGESLVFGIQKGKVDEYLRERGFSNIHDVDGSHLKQAYCTGVNEQRNVVDHYAIVSAEV